MALGSVSDDGLFIHDEFYWSDGTITSPVESTQTAFSFTPFDTNRLARYTSITGIESEGLFPANNATGYMASNKIDFDTLVFSPASGYPGPTIPPAADKFSFLVSNTLYTSSQADINALVAAATDITTVTNPSTGYYEANFTYSNPSNRTYLYLIYNYSGVSPIQLRYGTTPLNSCCLGSFVDYFINTDSFTTATSVYTDSDLTTLAVDGFYSKSGIVREQSSGLLISSASCASPCNYVYVTGIRPSPSDLCTSNYVMSFRTQTTTNNDFIGITPGMTFSQLPSASAGYVAYSSINGAETATATTFRIAQVSATGQILSILNGGTSFGTGSCGTPL